MLNKWISFLIVSLVLAGNAGFASSYVRTLAQKQRWSIGNDFVERTVSFSARSGLRTDALLYKLTGHDYTSYDRSQNLYGSEFEFRIGKQSVTGTSLVFSGADIRETPGGKILQIRLAERDSSLDISVDYAVYDDSPALRKWISITNRSEHVISLSHVSFEVLTAAPGTPADLQVMAGYGAIARDLFFTGRVSDPAIFVRSALTGEGFTILNEAPGYLKRTEVGESWNEIFRVMYDTDLFPFKRSLQPSETFETAKCSLVFFLDNRGFADPRWTIPIYVSKHIARRPANQIVPWIYNTWEPFERNIDEKTVAELAPAARAMGLNVFTIDDGWQAEYGTNILNLKSFPGGISQIESILHKNDLKLGLWVPLAAISTNSPDYRAHPECVCRNPDGTPKSTRTASGMSVVMCLGSQYRDSALRRLEDLVAQYHPAYVKVDLTTVFNAYGEAPGCYARGHFHRDWAESLVRIYEGLQYIGRQLYRTHPEVLVDFTFELWGEKHLIDPALLECADLDWLSNVEDQQPDYGGPLHARTLLYQRALSIPAQTMLIGNLHASTASIEERFATAIGSAPLFLGDLRKLSNSERQWYANKIHWYDELRTRVALSDSFFPLGDWQQPKSTEWDGFARLSRDSDGVIVLFKNESNANAVDLRFTAAPEARYKASSVITGANLGQVSAAELERGWQVSIPTGHRVEILDLHRIGR